MKRLMMVGTAVLLAGLGFTFAGAFAADAPKTEAAPAATQPALDLTKDPDRISYSIGMKVATDFTERKMPINPEAFIAGFKETIGGKSRFTVENMESAMMAAQQEMMAKAKAELAKAGLENKAKGVAYLAKNKTAEGVKTTPSGLQYKVLKEGAGKSPGINDTVTVKYRGTLIDGTEFDNSEKHPGPISFPVGQVIPGWTEALQLMKVGSKFQLAIPSELAYGEAGAGGPIGPSSVLLFDVELVEIKATDDAAKPAGK
ncbi:MAG: FKBP-type peptidyl-prolyl cis-trans isomerase [Planctomycetota bacterium]|nr:FKBP-type peptidyl-prolyl cis-trans isomerase [Planctomycetota bacterium]